MKRKAKEAVKAVMHGGRTEELGLGEWRGEVVE